MGGITDLAKGIGGGIASLAGKGGSSQRSDADRLMREAYEGVKSVELPSIESLQITPDEIEFYQQTGKLTPRLETAIAQDPSLMQKIQANPELVKAQLGALTALQQVGEEGGLTVADRAKLFEAQRAGGRQAAADREAILQRFRERGLGGSQAQLMSDLMASDAAAERGAQAGFDVGKEALNRALSAILQSGTLASQLRTQEFGEQEAKAKAQDYINMLNTQNLRAVQERNTAAQNVAAAANLAEQQRIAEQNVGLQNRLVEAQKNLLREDYARRLEKEKLASDAARGFAGYQSQRAAQEDVAGIKKGEAIGGLIGLIPRAGAAMYTGGLSEAGSGLTDLFKQQGNEFTGGTAGSSSKLNWRS